MAALKRAVFVSDLHLGSNPLLDDFLRDDEFARLLGMPELQVPTGGTIDLVLLGDTFDLWQTVTDEECGKDPERVPVEYDSDGEARRVRNVIEQHSTFSAALREFASRPGTRVFFVPGNHDHSLVHADVQQAVRSALGGTHEKVLFPLAYEDADLGIYAEHGNQYDKNTRYERFPSFDWKEDCRGYYFVRLFFNRIERLDPHIENSPGGWSGVWHWLRRVQDPKLIVYALRCWFQYRHDSRVKRHVVLGLTKGMPESQPYLVELPDAPEFLVGVGDPATAPEHFFSSNPETEAFLRNAYFSSPEVKEEIDRILKEQGRPGEMPPQGAPKALMQPMAFGLGTPEDIEWAKKLFTSKPALRDTELNSDTHRCVIFGHTHEARVIKLSKDAKYLNTGTWTVASGPVPVAFVDKGQSPELRCFHRDRFTDVIGQRCWKDGARGVV